MEKVFIRFFLSLCIILLSGYSKLYAHTYQDGMYASSVKVLQNTAPANLGTLQTNEPSHLKLAPVVTEKENHDLYVTETEEKKNEFLSFKKYLASSKYFTSVFYALLGGFFWLFLKKRFPSCQHSFYFSSYKWYLLFRVFRI